MASNRYLGRRGFLQGAMCGIKMGVDAYRQDKVIFWDGEHECYADTHPRPNRDSKFPAPSS